MFLRNVFGRENYRSGILLVTVSRDFLDGEVQEILFDHDLTTDRCWSIQVGSFQGHFYFYLSQMQITFQDPMELLISTTKWLGCDSKQAENVFEVKYGPRVEVHSTIISNWFNA